MPEMASGILKGQMSVLASITNDKAPYVATEYKIAICDCNIVASFIQQRV